MPEGARCGHTRPVSVIAYSLCTKMQKSRLSSLVFCSSLISVFIVYEDDKLLSPPFSFSEIATMYWFWQDTTVKSRPLAYQLASCFDPGTIQNRLSIHASDSTAHPIRYENEYESTTDQVWNYELKVQQIAEGLRHYSASTTTLSIGATTVVTGKTHDISLTHKPESDKLRLPKAANL